MQCRSLLCALVALQTFLGSFAGRAPRPVGDCAAPTPGHQWHLYDAPPSLEAGVEVWKAPPIAGLRTLDELLGTFDLRLVTTFPDTQGASAVGSLRMELAHAPDGALSPALVRIEGTGSVGASAFLPELQQVGQVPLWVRAVYDSVERSMAIRLDTASVPASPLAMMYVLRVSGGVVAGRWVEGFGLTSERQGYFCLSR